MLKFFEPGEIGDLSKEQQQNLNAKMLNKVTEEYNHNYKNCIITGASFLAPTSEILIKMYISLE